MIYSLINVTAVHAGKVSGYWLQDHIGTLDTARARAQRTVQVNGDRIIVAVVPKVTPTRPILEYFEGLEQL